jgi:potassium-transporting ATPase ATP-binding subunit
MPRESVHPDAGGADRPASRRLVTAWMVRSALVESLRMLHPLRMVRNPVMFVTEVGAAITTMYLAEAAWAGGGNVAYFAVLTVTLWLTVVFANFAEALAEARGKAQANALRKSRKEVRRRQ